MARAALLVVLTALQLSHLALAVCPHLMKKQRSLAQEQSVQQSHANFSAQGVDPVERRRARRLQQQLGAVDYYALKQDIQALLLTNNPMWPVDPWGTSSSAASPQRRRQPGRWRCIGVESQRRAPPRPLSRSPWGRPRSFRHPAGAHRGHHLFASILSCQHAAPQLWPRCRGGERRRPQAASSRSLSAHAWLRGRRLLALYARKVMPTLTAVARSPVMCAQERTAPSWCAWHGIVPAATAPGTDAEAATARASASTRKCACVRQRACEARGAGQAYYTAPPTRVQHQEVIPKHTSATARATVHCRTTPPAAAEHGSQASQRAQRQLHTRAAPPRS